MVTANTLCTLCGITVFVCGVCAYEASCVWGEKNSFVFIAIISGSLSPMSLFHMSDILCYRCARGNKRYAYCLLKIVIPNNVFTWWHYFVSCNTVKLLVYTYENAFLSIYNFQMFYLQIVLVPIVQCHFTILLNQLQSLPP